MTVIINGSNTPTAGAVAVGDGTTLNFTAAGNAGQILQSNGASVPTWINNDAGTVTSASVVSANGFAGTVANASTTPAITLSTSITGVLKGNGTALSAATAGTDYLAPPSGTALLKANSGGALANATAGTDYVAPATATSFTAKQSFIGSSSVLAEVLQNAAETVNYGVSSPPASTQPIYLSDGAITYFGGNTNTNWVINFSLSSGVSMNTALTIGQSVTIAILATNGGTAYYNTSVQVDGTTSGVTTKWQGGTAPTSGNTSSIDVYTYTIIKTASATFTVLASQTKFA